MARALPPRVGCRGSGLAKKRYILSVHEPATQGETMSAPPRDQEPGLNRRDELAVSSAAMSAAPWSMAGAAGAGVTGGGLVLPLIGGPPRVTRSPSAGAAALFSLPPGRAVLP